MRFVIYGKWNEIYEVTNPLIKIKWLYIILMNSSKVAKSRGLATIFCQKEGNMMKNTWKLRRDGKRW